MRGYFRLVNRARREEGSIIMAMMIIMIVVTLVTAVSFQVIGNQSVIRARQATATAVSLADAGISDALFRLDQGGSTAGYTSSTGTWASFCVGATGCAAPSVPGAPTDKYKVVPNSSSNPNYWTIYSKATSGNQAAAVVESVYLTAQYPFAIFTNQRMTLNGTSNMTWTTYSSSSSVPDTSQNLAIGSDQYLSCNGNLSSNVFPQYYQANGSTTGAQCGVATTTDYVFSTPQAPNPYTVCPTTTGQLGSGASPAITDIGATDGSTTTYYCTQPLSIIGHLKVDGPVKLYIILNPPAPSGDTMALSLAGNSYTNDEYDYCINVLGKPASYCNNTYGQPVSTNLQVFTNSTLDVGDSNGKGLYFAGILDAPQAAMTENGCKGVWYGSLILNDFTCNGGSSGFTLNYDEALSQVYGPEVIAGYRQVSPSSFTVP